MQDLFLCKRHINTYYTFKWCNIRIGGRGQPITSPPSLKVFALAFISSNKYTVCTVLFGPCNYGNNALIPQLWETWTFMCSISCVPGCSICVIKSGIHLYTKIFIVPVTWSQHTISCICAVWYLPDRYILQTDLLLILFIFWHRVHY